MFRFRSQVLHWITLTTPKNSCSNSLYTARLAQAQIRLMSSSKLHPFVLYAPDYTDEGALQRRLKVRAQHFKTSHELRAKGVYGIAGGLLSDDGVGAADPAKSLIGSMIIINAESLEKAKEIAKNDIYWTENVWDKDRMVVHPFLVANLSTD